MEVGDVDVDIGANPSAEEAEEGVDSGAKKVVNLQDAFRLQEGPSYSKKELMTYLKVRVATARDQSGFALPATMMRPLSSACVRSTRPLCSRGLTCSCVSVRWYASMSRQALTLPRRGG